MSTHQTLSPAVTHESTGRVRNIALWSLQILLAINFLMAGGLKLSGAQQMVDVFAAVGVGQWFRYFTGGAEVIGALLLLVPATSGLAAVLLAVVMVGATLAELIVLSGQALIPLVLLVLLSVVAYARRDDILRVIEIDRRHWE